MNCMKKIMCVFGTRPEAIKMAPLINELKNETEHFKVIVCVTGQHRQMLDQVLTLFDIRPDFDLNVMKPGQDLYDITSLVLLGLKDILKKEQPDLILVHGDTTTSMAAALAAFYQQIPVGHVEAGLRTHAIYNPWPEEMNRSITSRIATLHFSPTLLSKKNLFEEGIVQNVFVTGNTVIDALQIAIRKINEEKELNKTICTGLRTAGIPENRNLIWRSGYRKLVLITAHRRENFGSHFIQICKAIKTLAKTNPHTDFVYPMHLNPNVRDLLQVEFALPETIYDNLFFSDPLDYLPFVYLMSLSTLVLTDSGGIQEEAPGLGKPVLVMRKTTERPEALEAGTVKLVGTDYNAIVNNVNDLLYNEEKYNAMSRSVNPYGNGKSSQKIVSVIKSYFQ